jgi:hypothetical protein
MSREPRVRFSLSTPEKEAVEDCLIGRADLVARGVEQPDGSFLFDLAWGERDFLLEGVAAAIDRADGPRVKAMLEAVWRRLSTSAE